ncbi:aminopeptidase P N-terminal domain-containing protein [Flavobacterium sp. ANB]|uniref:aminopeptidase P N-terminal domain-containing protein n=1 Tax=unclassified Flavobacterium TaxID=196869 RepID=UPI0012B8F050|nr:MULTISPECIES: aminopeptidase P N-terminal domain-containing protein [unclassified Flavobacterium]MBF4517549.1 aminopeptidase P N-terminal domain-containing protein [Flavobacterium sp. ANB]MTD70276.1 M24 family metallopeptidase [Flavobacterium sp. LC2016-13]
MKRLLFLFIFLITINQAHSQENLPTDYLSKEFHKGRREAFRALMPANSVAVVFSYPERVFSRDINYNYHANPDMYYLTGYKEPDAVLFIFKDAQTNGETELFFVREKNANREMWTGRRLGIDEAKSKLGISTVYNGKDFKDFVIDFKKFDKIIYDKIPTDIGNNKSGFDLFGLLESFKTKAEITKEDELSLELFRTITNSLREIKTPEEMVLMRKTVKLSCIAHNEVMKAVGPDMSENEADGIHAYIHRRYGAEDEGYPPIVGAGANGCILHYGENNSTKIDNQLLLMDVGSEYHGYSADVTRTIPANGKFTAEQKAIYQLVYDAQEAVFKICKEGTPLADLNNKAKEVLAAGLIKLGIITDPKDVKLYYPHGCSHFLGLDVHDKGNYSGPTSLLKENMVITVEPGIYIPANSKCDKKWWNIGVRIEDDIAIKKDSYENLSADAPRKWDEIEKLAAQKSTFNEMKLPKI